MSELTQDRIYRCAKKECGAEVRVVKSCRCDDDCHLTCCGEKMTPAQA